MAKDQAIAKRTTSDLSELPDDDVQLSPTNPIGALMKGVIKSGITQDSAAALEKLTALYERMEDRNAQRQFAEAFVALQSDIPKVKGTGQIKQTNGTVRSTYATYEDLMVQIEAALEKHGFSVAYDAEHLGDKMVAICKMRHRGGHVELTKYATRIGAAAGGNSAAQADTGAMTTAKRVALCNALNIVVGDENDARNLGDTITPEEAKELAARVRAIAPDADDAWLALAGAERWEDVRTAKAKVVWAELRTAEAKAKIPAFPASVTGWSEGLEDLFQTMGKSSADFTDYIGRQAKRFKHDSYLQLTEDQRRGIWIDAHRRALEKK